MLNPLQDDGCQPDPDPRLSPEEAARIAGQQYTGLPYRSPPVFPPDASGNTATSNGDTVGP